MSELQELDKKQFDIVSKMPLSIWIIWFFEKFKHNYPEIIKNLPGEIIKHNNLPQEAADRLNINFYNLHKQADEMYGRTAKDENVA